MGWTFYNASGQQLRNTGTVLATQAEMEAGSSIAAFVTPGRTQYHPGVAKVWVTWEQSGAHGIIVGHNMTSVTDGGGVGDTDHLWNVDFSGNDYVVVGSASSNINFGPVISTMVAGGITSHTFDLGNSASDEENCLAAFGDQ